MKTKMAIYKKVRKSYWKALSKDQKKIYKDYLKDLADSLLVDYVEILRLKKDPKRKEEYFLPVENDLQIRVRIQTDKMYELLPSE